MDNEVLEEFDKYILSNKDVLNVLPTNTKKNRKLYLEKVDELYEDATRIKDVIWKEINKRYNKLIKVETNPKIAELTKTISCMEDVELFNELNTPFEKLGIDKICHSLHCFYEADLILVNKNIKKFVDIMKKYHVKLTADDFSYSSFVNEYMVVFFQEMATEDNANSERLQSSFEQIYWKCPDLVTHIELNIRYIYYINSKQIEKELEERNARALDVARLDKNGLVKQFFELNKDLIKAKRVDPKYVFDKFYSGEWKIKDFNDKEMAVLYDRYSTRPYFQLAERDQNDINNNFGKLLNTLQEYNTYIRYKYIIDDLRAKYQNKESLKDNYDKIFKDLRKKEQELLKENQKNKKIKKYAKSPILKLFRKKFERKIYEFPVASNAKIKELNELYQQLDEEAVNQRIIKYVDDGCSIKYMFKIATSFYTYVYRLVKEHYVDDEINIDDEIQGLIDFINQPYKVMLNNIKLIEEPEIQSIISSRYKILSIRLEQEDLIPESIDEVILDIEKIVNYYNIKRSGLDFDDIDFVERAKIMIEKSKK